MPNPCRPTAPDTAPVRTHRSRAVRWSVTAASLLLAAALAAPALATNAIVAENALPGR